MALHSRATVNQRSCYDVAIIGAGFAGAATAWHLAAQGAGSLLVLEHEDAPGVHASGRNAEVFRSIHADPHLVALSLRSRDLLADIEAALPAPLLDRRGVLLVGRAEELGRLAAAAGPDVKWLTPDQCVALVPYIDAKRIDGGVLSPQDGRIDAGRLLSLLLDGARRGGADVAFSTGVTAIERAPSGLWRLTTPRCCVEARVVVNAAGAWANEVAALAGIPPKPFQPYRRHLFRADSSDAIGGPVVWDVSDEFYARDDAGALLMSPCDQAPAAPGPAVASPEAPGWMLAKLSTNAPSLLDCPIHEWWACLRTIADDGRFVIGPEPGAPGFVWVAALGGHGVTTALAVGELAARAILDPNTPPGPTAAGRFLPSVHGVSR